MQYATPHTQVNTTFSSWCSPSPKNTSTRHQNSFTTTQILFRRVIICVTTAFKIPVLAGNGIAVFSKSV